ncbi:MULTISPECIES: hypothetical protein [Pseudomonas]|jgi:hypothetical protein|uniref:hypothetical protein n=1 Tax=Pseudomonas TaxID=286 RepID=UPI00081BF18B|nr:hypothetical protein [Pseudomonas sp. S3E12]OCW23997.1 hypothetical protein BB029_12795 [Pseudomonas sp. S3E12]
MITPTDFKRAAAQFIQFSGDMCLQVTKVVTSVEQVEKAHDEVTSAILNTCVAQDLDNVVRQALMERILRREMILLLAAVDRMKRALVVSITILIKRGRSALCKNRRMFLDRYQDYPELENAQAQLVVSLDLLRIMEHRLSFNKTL